MSTTATFWPLAEALAEYERIGTVPRFGCSPNRAVPKSIRHLDLWEEAAERVYDSTGIHYDDWTPKQFAACMSIYKRKVEKHRG